MVKERFPPKITHVPSLRACEYVMHQGRTGVVGRIPAAFLLTLRRGDYLDGPGSAHRHYQSPQTGEETTRAMSEIKDKSEVLALKRS